MMRRARGFSLIELLVSAIIVLFLVMGVAVVFQSNEHVARTSMAMADLQNATQAAGSLMGRTITTAGFMGCSGSSMANSILNPTSGVLNAYTTAVYGNDGNAQGGTLVISDPGQSTASGGTWSPALPDSLQGKVFPGSDVIVTSGEQPGTTPTIATDIVTGADTLTVQNTGAFSVGEVAAVSDCAKATVFEVTGVGGNTLSHDAGGSTPGNAVTSFSPAYPTGAQVAPLQQTAFYLAPGFDGQPMLVEAVNQGGAWVVSPLLPNVDAMRVLYGINSGGSITAYVPASQVTNWGSIGSVRVGLLVAGPEGSATGNGAATTTWSLLDESVQLPTDTRLRHAVIFTFNTRNLQT